MASFVIWTEVKLQQADGTQDILGTGDELLNANFLREGAKGEAHQLGKIEDGNSIAGVISPLNLPLTAVEVCLAKRARDRDGLGSSLPCLTKNIV